MHASNGGGHKAYLSRVKKHEEKIGGSTSHGLGHIKIVFSETLSQATSISQVPSGGRIGFGGFGETL